MPTFLALEQQVQALSDEVGELKDLLRAYLDINRVSHGEAMGTARKIAEHVVNQTLARERLQPRDDLIDNIETLGGGGGAAQRRQGRPPVVPTTIYTALHLLRVYGNANLHPYSATTGERKVVDIDSLDVHSVLAASLRVVAWYFQEYDGGPRLKNLYPGQPEPTLGRFSDVPPDISGLVGRNDEIAHLLERVRQPQARVTALIAPGGMGKSLLASKVAQLAVADGSAGTSLLWFDLSSGPTFADVTARALASLLPDANARPTDADLQLLAPAARTPRLVRLLAERPVLIVLDNLESWLDPVTGRATNPAVDGLLGQLATAAHRSRVLLTARLEPAGCVTGPPAFEVVPLRGLTESAFAQMLRGQGVTGPDQTMNRAWAAFGGNTRLLLFLADVVRRRHGGDLIKALKRQPELLARTAEPLLNEIWGELPSAARDVLRTLALLNRPTRETELRGVFAALFPSVATDVGEEIWQRLAPRDLTVFVEEADGFRVQHPLICEFAAGKWDDPVAAHRTAARFFLGQAGILSERGPLTDEGQADLLTAYDHALAARDRDLAERVLLNTPLVYDLWWRRGSSARLSELCGAFGRAFGVPDRPEAPGWAVLRWHGAALRGLDQRLASVEIHERCRRAAVERGDQGEECRSLIELCSGYRHLTQLDDARAAGLSALRLTETLELPHERAELLLKLAKVERFAGRRGPSVGYAEASRSAAETLGRDDLAGKAHAEISVLLRISDPLEAERHTRRGLELVQRAGARLLEANLLGRLGELFLQQRRWDEALDYLNRALALRLELGHRSVLDRANLGLVRLARGERAEAVGHFRTALELALCRDLQRELATVLGHVGEGYAQPGMFALAAACGQAALEFYQARGMNTVRRERFMETLRSAVEAAGEDWAAVDRAARDRRAELLAEATGVPADRWRALTARLAGPALS